MLTVSRIAFSSTSSCRRPAVSHLAHTQVGELSTRTARSEARAGDAEINASEARAFAGGVESRLNELRLETTQAARELWAYVDDWKIWKTAQEQVSRPFSPSPSCPSPSDSTCTWGETVADELVGVQGLSELSNSLAPRFRTTDSRLDAQAAQHELAARRTDAIAAVADGLRVEIAALKTSLEDSLALLAQAERRHQAQYQAASNGISKESADRLLGEAALRERIKATEASLVVQEGKLKLALAELERVHRQLEPLHTAVSGTCDAVRSLKVGLCIAMWATARVVCAVLRPSAAARGQQPVTFGAFRTGAS